MTSGARLVPSSTLFQKQTSDLGDPRGQRMGKQWESPGPSLVSCGAVSLLSSHTFHKKNCRQPPGPVAFVTTDPEHSGLQFSCSPWSRPWRTHKTCQENQFKADR